MIEVCVEASLQPILQLYLVLVLDITILSKLDWTKMTESTLSDIFSYMSSTEFIQIFTAFTSIISIAISFTTNYNKKKERVLSIGGALVYFFYIFLAILARILCFLVFILSLGIGKFSYAYFFIGAHVFIMICLNIFLTHYQRDENNSWLEKLTKITILQNYILNGFASIYIYYPIEDFELKTGKEIENSEFQRRDPEAAKTRFDSSVHISSGMH